MAPGPAKNKKGTGLKILWIPGRKKHHDKGIYQTTKYRVEHKHGDRKNESWSLGGSKVHDDIVSGKEGRDTDDKHDLFNPSTPSTCVLPSASVGVATVNVDDYSESESEIKLTKCIIKDIEYKKYDIRDSIQCLTSTVHKHSAQSAGEGGDKRSARRTSTQKDFDSIECFDDLDGESKQNGKSAKENSKSCKRKSKEDKIVDCLYYTMMCCECTIS